MVSFHEFYSECQGRRLGSFFEIRQFRWTIPFMLKSESVTECKLHGRRKKGGGWGVGTPL